MFKTKILSIAFSITFMSFAFGEVAPKSMAPDFKLQDLKGSDRKLSDFKGKWVVLEWFNKDCPFVKKHYGTSNMQNLQQTYTGKGVVWLTINSSAAGKQGNEDVAASIKTQEALKTHNTYYLADASGVVGNLYGAKTTPHMFVISPEQKVVYAGAIDDNDSPDPSVIAKSKNYVAQALDLAMAGKAVMTAHARPYGCMVKY
ncbi:MAG: redoxin domain-containing protein [Bdellovibrionales bacterium]|nr:redoxin domain-containing protein [Bdellovibrionales bacterium]